MTATYELRRLLDERGVEWRGGLPTETMVEADGLDLLYVALQDGRVRAFIRNHLTPEQAIEATLGRGECHVESVQQDCNMTRYGWVCDRCHGLTIGFAAPHFCSVCGRKVRA